MIVDIDTLDKNHIDGCKTCKWWHSEVCCNGDSIWCSDFKIANDTCDLWEEKEDG